MSIQTVINQSDLRHLRAEWDKNTQSVAFVPTMGALHAGHLSLIKQAKKQYDRVIASIFVNPKQFGPKEDFEKYPRTLQSDLNLLSEVECDAAYLPTASEIYPKAFQTFVVNETQENDLCGRSRPGHFRGVLTVVAKLFNLVQPHAAFFGKKDYQQVRLIEIMTKDLNFPIKIVPCETMREQNGLAMSSRNKYLPPETLDQAATLYRAMKLAQDAFESGEKDPAKLINLATDTIKKDNAFEIDYVELRQQSDLAAFTNIVEVPAVLLVAAHFNGVRLIDNMEFHVKGQARDLDQSNSTEDGFLASASTNEDVQK